MKKKYFILVMMCVFCCFFLNAQQKIINKQFYYYKGEKVYLSIDYSRVSIVSERKIDMNLCKKVIPQPNCYIKNEKKSYTRQHVIPVNGISKTMQNDEIFITELEFSPSLNQMSYFELIQYLSKEDNIIKITPTFSLSNQNLGISNNFYVKLFKKDDMNDLFDLAERYSIQVLGYNEFMPLWFTLSCGKETSFDAIGAANLFYETGLFESAEPELLYHNLLASNDQYFSNQWGLKNDGQHPPVLT
ncbi:MAG: hypothetical protein FWG84_08605 [Bacteroidales bacterium]|nr:hypothetical protein [Bacteroidales bacterium]